MQNANFINNEYVRNTKTGSTGFVVSRYNRTSDGKAMVEVRAFHSISKSTYWQADHVEAVK